MSGKKGRSGRPNIGGEKRAYQVRLVEAQADEFDAKVKAMDEEAMAKGARVSAASVLQMLVAWWLAGVAGRVLAEAGWVRGERRGVAAGGGKGRERVWRRK